MSAPEAYSQFTPGLFTETGELTGSTTAQFLTDCMNAFKAFIWRVLAVVKDSGEVEVAA